MLVARARSPDSNCQEETSVRIGSKGAIIVETLGREAPSSQHDDDEGVNERHDMHVPVERSRKKGGLWASEVPVSTGPLACLAI